MLEGEVVIKRYSGGRSLHVGEDVEAPETAAAREIIMTGSWTVTNKRLIYKAAFGEKYSYDLSKLRNVHSADEGHVVFTYEERGGDKTVRIPTTNAKGFQETLQKALDAYSKHLEPS